MNKRWLVQMLVARLTEQQKLALLDSIIAGASEDATFDGYFDLTDFLPTVVDHE